MQRPGPVRQPGQRAHYSTRIRGPRVLFTKFVTYLSRRWCETGESALAFLTQFGSWATGKDGGASMDNARFDRITRDLGRRPTRRGVLGMALSAVVATLLTAQKAEAQVGVPGGMCGGIAGIPCPDGYTCIDNPGDGCDPNAGGADCSGICVPADYNPCAAMLCVEGTTCCPNCGGLCVPADTPCSDELCQYQQCNEVVCGPGEYCCNESCSRCVRLGAACTREFCGPEVGEPCGANTCGPDEFCCNESCGICAPIGGSCTEEFCEPGAEGVPCGRTVCPVGQVCCNDSCGICTPPDGVCIALFCVD